MFSSENWFGAEAGFYNSVATQSLRFDNGSSAYLSRTPSSATNRKTFIWSCWIKPSAFGKAQPIFSAYTGATNYSIFGFDLTGFIGGGDSLKFWTAISNSTVCGFTTNALFRDPSAWYHIVLALDTTQATDTNRVKIYVNGTQITSFATATYPAQDADAGMINSDVLHQIGTLATGTYGKLDGYIAEVNFVDGLSFFSDTSGTANTSFNINSFGETKNGVWIPKEYTGSYGTNGFRLQFNQTGTGTASASTIGADTSGNTNHWTSSGIVASDCNMPDSPENNFATLNPLYATAQAVFAEGNLKVNFTDGTFNSAGSTISTGSMKFYTEVLISASTGNPAYAVIGVVNADKFGWNSDNYNPSSGSNGVGYFCDTGAITNGYGDNATGATLTTGDILGIACDPINGTVAFYKNGTLQDTVTVTTGLAYNVAMADTSRFTTNATFIVNFGQDSSFAGNKTSGSENAQDSNGIGDFYDTVPSGFLALCTANLPEPTISPNADTIATDHFEAILYSASSGSAGAGSSTPQDIGGLDFKPDWVWIKGRSYADAHALFDSSRGVGKYLLSNATNAEGNVADTLDEFRSDGFGLGADSTALVNYQNNTYVSWNWKANGGTTTTNDASATSIGSQDSVYQANTTAGFSIVTYTGTGSNDTFAHGLGVAPKFIIFKRTDSAQQWVIYHEVGTGNTRSMLFNTDAPNSASAVNFNNTSPTSTVFSLGTDAYANGSGGTYVAYCFAEVEGYSKIGKFIGNANGTFIFTGFQPKYLLFTNHTTGYNWVVKDGATSPINVRNKHLVPDLPQGEGTFEVADFVSNGFKMRTTDRYFNGAGETYQYLAIGGNPFKYGNGI